MKPIALAFLVAVAALGVGGGIAAAQVTTAQVTPPRPTTVDLTTGRRVAGGAPCREGFSSTAPSPARSICFWLFALLAVAGGLLTITRRSAVSAVMWLVATFLALSATYVLLFAHFIAIIQVLVYAGAIMVLFVFVIMILNKEEEEPWAVRGIFGKGMAGLALLYLVVRLFSVLYLSPVTERPCISDRFGTTLELGKTLFSTYLFPFEAVSIVLLIAVVGALVLAHPSHIHDDAGEGGGPS
jgi:NADH-quinone oxidoreductase subunit J